MRSSVVGKEVLGCDVSFLFLSHMDVSMCFLFFFFSFFCVDLFFFRYIYIRSTHKRGEWRAWRADFLSGALAKFIDLQSSTN